MDTERVQPEGCTSSGFSSRTKCKYCDKIFSRTDSARRHEASSCTSFRIRKHVIKASGNCLTANQGPQNEEQEFHTSEDLTVNKPAASEMTNVTMLIKYRK